MPGYREIPDGVEGHTADFAREASRLEAEREYEAARHMYEAALAYSLTLTPVLPGFVCGRLAALYRRLRRFDDEVALLEAYRSSQVCDQARVRYDARLSKARAIAEKMRRRDSGALASVRAIKPPASRTKTPEAQQDTTTT